jgi:murein DD-endopeptidase MepM/ murein hydrolase activator NlpD
MSWRIAGSVGRWDGGARNNRRDVETVQTLLASAAVQLADASLDPGVIDGAIARPPARSATVAAIEAFQQRFMATPDGVIHVNGRTWNTLVREAGGHDGATPNPNQPGTFYFPFSALPRHDWHSGARAFGANRSQGTRAHAGCDLYFPQGTWIHAVTDGLVVRGPEWFYAQTYALEIDHGDHIIRYGEVQGSCPVRIGDQVQAGQKLARIGRLVGINVPSDMLHMEMYDKSAAGPLTVSGSDSARRSDGVPFNRRRDLIDPTQFLEDWSGRLAEGY